MHLNDETLRAHLDQELDDAGRAAGHLQTCPDCRSRLAKLKSQAARVKAHLAALDPTPAEAPRSAQLAFAQFTARQLAVSGKERFAMLKSIFSQRLRPVWVGLGIIVLLAGALSFAPVRAWAGDMLSLFRVQKIVVLPVDTTRLGELGNDETVGKQISSLLSDSVTVTKKADKPKVVADAAQASQAADFAVRLPTNRTDTPLITVQDGTAFQLVVNRARAQALLDEAGLEDLKLPASLDGATIKVVIPAGVTAGYGDCPKPDETANAVKSEGSPGRRMANCVLLAEIPSPSVTTPPDLDMEQLAEIGLQFTGMTPEQAHAYSQTVDWTSTLVVPIPRNGASHKQVAVDGVTGYLIQRPTDDAPQYALIWVKNGIIYAIGGVGSDTADALAMGNALK
jgi:anti-sigma factor RsiW